MTQRRFRTVLATPRAVVTAGAVVVLFMFVVCGVALYQAHEDARAHARDMASNLALIVDRDIERNFELYALSLQAVVEGFRDPEVMALPPDLRQKVLFDRAATARYLGAFRVLDTTGKVQIEAGVATPRPDDLSAYDYFTMQRDHPDTGLFVSTSFTSTARPGVEPGITLSRRLSNPDGSFAGVAVIVINLRYFQELLSGLSIGPHGSVSLIDRQGRWITRLPYREGLIGQQVDPINLRHFLSPDNAGSFVGRSTRDNTRRLYVYKKLTKVPMVVIVAPAERDIYAAWRRRTWTISLLLMAFGAAFVGLCASLGAQLRQRLRAEERLSTLARTDGLTGLNNRRSLDETLSREWRHARRTQRVFSILFVDIDYFKIYNDTFGHQPGDDVLVAVAACIAEHLRRPGDSAARYGGDEFVIVLPETPIGGALAIAQRICAAVQALAIDNPVSAYGSVTVSIGVASSDTAGAIDLPTLLSAADRALYDAKSNGRNRAALHGGEPVAALQPVPATTR